MAAQRVPGPICCTRDRRGIDPGTLCRERTAPPTSVGTEPRDWLDDVGDFFGRAGRAVSGHGKSTLIKILDLVPFKKDSPHSTALLRHYVEGSGEEYTLKEIPIEWQDWIVKKTGGRPGTYKDLSPYNVGIYDLQNSLGHFDVEVKRGPDRKRIYDVSDLYHFGYKKNDRKQQGRHGFPLGDLDPDTIKTLRWLLPSTRYCNPGGFEEGWEIKRVGKETILFIPQQFLEEQGRPFRVKGTFTR